MGFLLVSRRLGLGLAAFLALFCAAPGLLFAQQQQFGQPPNTYLTWGTNSNSTRIDVTYFIGAGFTGNMPNLIRQAAAQWSASGSRVNLVEVGTLAASQIRLSAAPVGVAALSQITRNSVAMPGTLNGQPWRQITAPETIVVNTNFAFWDGVGPQAANQFDFQSVILDLMGYSIGLGFVTAGTDPGSVMQPTFASGVPGNHTLSPTDLASVQAVYGTPEPGTLALLGIGLGVLGATRRRRPGA